MSICLCKGDTFASFYGTWVCQTQGTDGDPGSQGAEGSRGEIVSDYYIITEVTLTLDHMVRRVYLAHEDQSGLPEQTDHQEKEENEDLLEPRVTAAQRWSSYIHLKKFHNCC